MYEAVRRPAGNHAGSVRRRGGERLVESSDAVLTTLRQAVEGGHWPGALELARVAEPAFEMGAHRGAWASALEMGLVAARAVGDRSAEGWALHEQGVRAIAIGSFDEAGELLSRALAIRTDVDDEEAAQQTRSQLARLTAITATTG